MPLLPLDKSTKGKLTLKEEIDDRAVPIDAGTLDSILNRVRGVNLLWSDQECSDTYLDFPNDFAVRNENGLLLGHLVWDEAESWLFMPVTQDAQEKDLLKRHKKNQPEPPPL